MNETRTNREPEAVAIGVDLGGTRIKAGLVKLNGEILASFQQDSPRTTSALRDFVASVRKAVAVPLVGIGIGLIGGSIARGARAHGGIAEPRAESDAGPAGACAPWPTAVPVRFGIDRALQSWSGQPARRRRLS